MSTWLAAACRDEPVDWLNDNSGAVQGIATAVLVLVTAFYAVRTYHISKATREQAEATREQAQRAAELAEETRISRLDSLRPILEISPVEMLDSRVLLKQGLLAQQGQLPPNLRCTVRNIGPGPALNVLLHIWRPDLEQPDSLEFGAIAAGEGVGARELHLAPADEADKRLLRVVYEDVYGRKFVSSRQVQVVPEKGTFDVGPLGVQQVQEPHDP